MPDEKYRHSTNVPFFEWVNSLSEFNVNFVALLTSFLAYEDVDVVFKGAFLLFLALLFCLYENYEYAFAVPDVHAFFVANYSKFVVRDETYVCIFYSLVNLDIC